MRTRCPAQPHRLPLRAPCRARCVAARSSRERESRHDPVCEGETQPPDVAVARCRGRRDYANAQLVLPRGRGLQLLEPEDLRRTVPRADDRSHLPSAFCLESRVRFSVECGAFERRSVALRRIPPGAVRSKRLLDRLCEADYADLEVTATTRLAASIGAATGAQIARSPALGAITLSTRLRAYPGRDVRAGRSWTERGGHETVPS